MRTHRATHDLEGVDGSNDAGIPGAQQPRVVPPPRLSAPPSTSGDDHRMHLPLPVPATSRSTDDRQRAARPAGGGAIGPRDGGKGGLGIAGDRVGHGEGEPDKWAGESRDQRRSADQETNQSDIGHRSRVFKGEDPGRVRGGSGTRWSGRPQLRNGPSPTDGERPELRIRARTGRVQHMGLSPGRPAANARSWSPMPGHCPFRIIGPRVWTVPSGETGETPVDAVGETGETPVE